MNNLVCFKTISFTQLPVVFLVFNNLKFCKNKKTNISVAIKLWIISTKYDLNLKL